MTVTLSSFLADLISNPILLVTVALTLGVILVNGWTDAPNAIATVVSTRAMTPQKAIIMAAIFNFFGVFLMTLINANVAETIYNMVDFSGDARVSSIALCASLFAIVLWAVAAWKFGIPTSESHALIAGLSGSAIALQGGLDGINGAQWLKVLYGLLISVVFGFILGFVITKIIVMLFKAVDRRVASRFFQKAQVAGGAAMAFMHGAQDGQKFMGVFLLGVFLARGQTEVSSFVIPVWLMVLCSLVMALGTSIGGLRIIKTVGMDMVKLKPYQGFCADAAGALSLFLCSIFGIPVSTTHTKVTAIMGVGAAKRASSVNWIIVKDMFLAWMMTFPGCALVGFVISWVFIHIL